MTKKKRNPEAFKAAKQFAIDATGYTSASPIFGKRLPEVLTMIEEKVRQAIVDNENAAYSESIRTLVDETLPLIEELKKRVAKQAIITSQMR